MVMKGVTTEIIDFKLVIAIVCHVYSVPLPVIQMALDLDSCYWPLNRVLASVSLGCFQPGIHHPRKHVHASCALGEDRVAISLPFYSSHAPVPAMGGDLHCAVQRFCSGVNSQAL